MDLARVKALMTRLGPLNSAAAELAYFLALGLVPFVGIAIILASIWLPGGLSASIGKVLSDVMPGSPVAGEVMGWARSSANRGWLTAGFLLALWSSFRFTSRCVGALGAIISGEIRSSEWSWRAAARSLLLLVVWMVALLATALFLLVTPFIERGLLRPSAMSGVSSRAFVMAQVLLVPGILFGAIWLTYRVIGGTRAGPFRVLLATLLVTLGWIVATLGFSAAVPLLWSAARLYGSLGSVVLFLIWANVIAWILLLGGFLLSSSDRTRR